MTFPPIERIKKAHQQQEQAKRQDVLLGKLLESSGKLKGEDLARVLEYAADKGIHFGRAAIELGLLTQQDVDAALAKQFQHPFIEREKIGEVPKELIAAYNPFSPKVESLRALRAQLTLGSLKGKENALAIVSSGKREGRTYLTSNLAVVFAGLGERTLVVDAHMQQPRQHEIFRVDNAIGLSSALAGHGMEDVIRPAPDLDNLWIMPSGARPPNPDELLARANFGDLCSQLTSAFDVVLFDTAPGASSTSADSVADRCKKVLVVFRRDRTSYADAKAFSHRMRARAKVVGSVLNRI